MPSHTDIIAVNGSDMPVFIALPEGSGPHPGVVTMCHIGGVDDFTRDRCIRLAEAGFIAAAPDIFHYHPWMEDRNERRASLLDKTIVDDINATIAHLETTMPLDPKRLGILGHCMGGRTALLGAGSIARFRALAFYYSGRTMTSWGDGPTPFERIGNIKARVIGFFGNLDTQPSPEDVNKIEAEMSRQGIEATFHRYDGAGHAFQDDSNPDQYHQPSAVDAWGKTLDFFKTTLG